jgi:hypothetical protein
MNRILDRSNPAMRTICALAALMLGVSWLSRVDGQKAQPAAPCRPAGSLIDVAGLTEASGIAVSRRAPGSLWAHNDSGRPVLFALDGNGAVTRRLQISGAEIEDWEDLAVGRCPAGSCLYIADIGDNNAVRKRISVFQAAEPAGGDASAGVDAVFHATYPTGPQDAEAFFVTGDGRLYIVTKGNTGPIALYRFPDPLRAGATVQLERVGEPRTSGRAESADRITGAATSPDGRVVVLRTHTTLQFYRTADLVAGNWRELARASLKDLREPQGEGVAFGADHTVYLVGEAGRDLRAGTFVRLSCNLAG